MGKKTIIAVTALALLGLGGGAYLELGGKAPAGAGEAAAEGIEHVHTPGNSSG
ncbi:hypothetical protein DZ915_024590, partial [Pseudomonas aeruginosa]|nr:hypothetical protein [Pseudomonas aeruginosa]